ncbi:hypothetical protein [Metabacillus endolithicus]|uniref:Phage protein n=1 Tax=Metabacillus endolithicus TaxID=1535204 RepID=A0ABW5C026_9BACI|nr:hypothetical protein [Metabacillus endolithicus]UPG65531.1 hypothetical protein MVE64_11480 [Metabacillus endolithicus]
MPIYHKITINGKVFFREFDSTRGYYENEMLTEAELIEQLLGEVVESEIEIDESEVERAIYSIPSPFQREMVQKYINYLEAVVESLE